MFDGKDKGGGWIKLVSHTNENDTLIHSPILSIYCYLGNHFTRSEKRQEIETNKKTQQPKPKPKQKSNACMSIKVAFIHIISAFYFAGWDALF